MEDLFRPSALRAFLESIGHQPSKRLSQNFLIDGNIVRKIVELSGAEAGEAVLEIGPGPGVLSQQLLRRGVRLLAVEKDTRLAGELQRLKAEIVDDVGELKVIESDVQALNLPETLSQFLEPGHRARVVANLPYHLTTPIMTDLLPCHNVLSSITVMVQDEVARRFVAQPGGKDYGSITVFLRCYSTPRYGFKVSRRCFFPEPGVDSAVVHFDLHPPPLEDMQGFFQLTRQAFQQRRKMLRSSLRALYEPSLVEQSLERIGCSPTSRPEVLSHEQFLDLYQVLTG